MVRQRGKSLTIKYLDAKRIRGESHNNSANFDGSNDKAVVSNAIFNGVTGNFTVAFWFKADTNGDAMMGSYDTGTPNWQIYFSGNEIKLSDGSVHVIPQMDFTAGTWYHMAWVRTSGSLQCFINGVVENTELSTNLGTFASSQTWTQTLDGNNDTFTFGNRGNGGSDDKWFDGQLSEVIFLTEALSQADITTLQTATAISVTTMANSNLQGYYPFTSDFNDSSAQGRNATVSGATIIAGSGQPNDKDTLIPAGVETSPANTNNDDESRIVYVSQMQGVKFTTGTAIIGKNISKISFYLRKTPDENNASPTGDIKITAWDAVGDIPTNGASNNPAAEFGTIDAATLTSSFVKYTFDISSAASYTVLVGSHIGLDRGTGNHAGNVWVQGDNSDNTHGQWWRSSWQEPYELASSGAACVHYAFTEAPNVLIPENTLFDETDTRAMYWLQNGEWKRHATYAQNFAEDNWVDQHSAVIGISTANSRLDWDCKRDGSNNMSSIELPNALSDTKWEVRFKAKWSAVNAGNASVIYFGMFDADSGSSITSNQDCICSQTMYEGSNKRLSLNWSDGGSPTGNYEYDPLSGDFAADTQYYYTLRRTSATTADITVRTGGYDGTVLQSTVDNTGSITATGLKYFKVSDLNDNATGLAFTGYMTELEIFDGVNL